MILRTTIPMFVTLPGAAMAHVGHIADAAGHGHWIALGAIGLAAAAALAAALAGRAEKGDKDDKEEAAPDAEPNAEPEDAPA